MTNIEQFMGMREPPVWVLHELIDCEFNEGTLRWKARTRDAFPTFRFLGVWNAKHAGKAAFLVKRQDGYLQGKLLGNTQFAHRVVWAMASGEWPDKLMDHINLDKADNRLSNLRSATRSQNQFNTPAKVTSNSGVKGVYFNKRKKKWEARIGADKARKGLGYFNSIEDAEAAYKRAAIELHGEFFCSIDGGRK